MRFSGNIDASQASSTIVTNRPARLGQQQGWRQHLLAFRPPEPLAEQEQRTRKVRCS